MSDDPVSLDRSSLFRDERMFVSRWKPAGGCFSSFSISEATSVVPDHCVAVSLRSVTSTSPQWPIELLR